MSNLTTVIASLAAFLSLLGGLHATAGPAVWGIPARAEGEISELRFSREMCPLEGAAGNQVDARELTASLPATYANCTTIAYQSWIDGDWEIMSMRGDGSLRTELTQNGAQDEAPSLAWGCQVLAFSSDRGGDDDIYALWLDSGNVSQITSHASDDVLPALSPDGTQVAFQSYRNGEAPEIYVTTLSDPSPVRLTWNGSYDGQPAWSPYGSQIAFISDRSGSKNIWLMNANGTGARQEDHALQYPQQAPGCLVGNCAIGCH